MKLKPFTIEYPDLSQVPSVDTFCATAKLNYNADKAAGIFRRCQSEALYIYQIEFNGRKHIGLVALNELEDFLQGKVKKHEHTLTSKEQKHLNLILRWKALLKPVLLTYPAVPEIREWLLQYTRHHHLLLSVRFEEDNHLHKVWAVTNPQHIQAIQEMFSRQVRTTYIADGHHRTTTMALLNRQYQELAEEMNLSHLFCAFFADDELEILDYNRAVRALDQFSPAHFMALLSRVFDIEPLTTESRPAQKHDIHMYMSREWFRLRWKPEILSRYPADQVLFDASLLNEWVLDQLLGITDVRTDSRIQYIDGSKGLRGVQKVCKAGSLVVGFVLFPVSFEDMILVAESGGSLPPKSTYFAPRLKSGLLVHSLEK